MKRRLLYIIVLILLMPFSTKASDSIRISLLTCEAGEEIYSLFGHTALRCECPAKGLDIVFNYGIFSFNTPHFALRFALGQTDYQLGAIRFQDFIQEYTYLQRGIWQQELNLNTEETERLLFLLDKNYEPQNRIYRYNFFFDNCATRPRDLIEQSINGKVCYPYPDNQAESNLTFRDIIHQYCHAHPWAQFGMDLCLGSQADRPIRYREMMFVPFYLEDYFDKAQITDSAGNSRPLVIHKQHILKVSDKEKACTVKKTVTPLQMSLLLFMATILFTIYGLRKRKTCWLFDLLLLLVYGIAGSILTFLACCSEHPAVSSNYLIILFHPLHILCLPWVIHKIREERRSIYMSIHAVLSMMFIACWHFIPQSFPISILPLVLCLFVRSAGNWIQTYRTEK